MKRLEIISLRTAGNCEKKVQHYMEKFCRIVKNKTSLKAEFYDNTSIPGDFMIIVTSFAKQDHKQGKNLGTYIADVMKQYGLVDHTSWFLVDNQ